LLPGFDAAPYAVVSDLNPCLPAVALASDVVGKLSEADREKAGSDFLGRLDTFTKRLDALSGVQECAYQTDRLALGVYHDADYPWSMGMVAVVRGGVGAVVDTATCYLLKQIIPFAPAEGIAPLPTDSGPTPSACFDIIRAAHEGQDYTIMWIGSSDVMCDALTNAYEPMIPGSGDFVVITADPNVAVRSGPDTSAKLVTRVPYGTIGRAACAAHGGTVKGSDLWIKLSINGSTGYVANAYVDGGQTDEPSC
jgi:hypothetical protein